MATKYLKSTTVKNHHYWCLIEAHREDGKILQKNLKYWGNSPPGEDYRKFIMPLDDCRPLDDLCLVNKTKNGTWHWQKIGDFEFWVRHEKKEWWFWNSFWSYALRLDAGGGCWLTRAQSRSESIKNAKESESNKNVKERKAIDLVPKLVELKLKPPALNRAAQLCSTPQ